MSVQSTNLQRTALFLKGSGIYLIALRRHVAERNSVRNKPAFSFRMPAIRSVVPALTRAHRARA